MKLNIKYFSLSIGIAYGIYLLFLGWMGSFGWGEDLVLILSSLFIGYSPSFEGGIIGCIWGGISGFVFGLFFSFIYNHFCCEGE